MTGAEVTAVLAVLAAAYPDKALTDEEISTWERHLAALEFDVAVATAERIIDHQKWFPRISEFREVATVQARHRSMIRPPALEASQDAREDFRVRGLAHIGDLRAQLRGEEPA